MSTLEIIFALIGSGGIGALISIIAGVIQNRRKSKTEQKGSAIEQSKETIDLVDGLLKKQLQWMAERMDSGDAVRQKEFSGLEQKMDKRFDNIEKENTKQNNLLADIVEFLNGDFRAFEERKHPSTSKPSKPKKK